MKITHGNQTINLFKDKIPKLCPISISGGCDSASLLFLVSKYFPEVELMPYTCRDQNAPLDAVAAQKIVAYIKNRFPENRIRDIEVHDFNDKTEAFLPDAELMDIMSVNETFKQMSKRKVSKIVQVDRISWMMMDRALSEYPDAIRLDGMTRNPPTSEMIKYDFNVKAERRRDQEHEHVEEYRIGQRWRPFSIYQPYCNVDKKFVAGVFLDHDLMEDYFPLTRSCVGTSPVLTKNFTQECKQCFWCHEKAWAFDTPVEELPVKYNRLPEYMLKGGPGDKNEPGNISTAEWWKNLDEKGEIEARKDDSIVQLAKAKEIFFCTIPFTQIYAEINGQYQACCFGAQSGVHVQDMGLVDWMENSDYMNNIRKEMTTPGSDLSYVKKTCKRCYEDEERYGRSRRTNCMKIHTNDPLFWNKINSKVEKYRATGKFKIKNSHYADKSFHTPSERIFEVQLKIYGSECNLACHMCDYSNSTTRMKELEKGMVTRGVWPQYAEGSNTKDAQLAAVLADKTKGTIEQIIELAPYIKSIKIIGGEPLIMKKQYEMLDTLVDTGHAPRISLKYQTNLTETKAGKHNLLNYIPLFNDVAVVASVDGIGPVIEYMRRKTDWQKVLKNVELCSAYDNAVVDFNGLVSFLSVMRFHELIDWCKEHPVIDQLNWAMLENPKALRTNNLPEPIKEKLIPLYEEWPDIQAALRKPAEPDVDIQDVFEYLLLQDQFYKGTKWEMHLFDIFPELEEFYVPKPMTPEREMLIASWSTNAKIVEKEHKDLLLD